MSGKTSIEWASYVWNFLGGCQRVSPGCGGGSYRGPNGEMGGCYAETMAGRIVRMGGGVWDAEAGVWRGELSKAAAKYRDLVRINDAGEARWTGKVGFTPELLSAPLGWTKPGRIFVASMSDPFHDAVTEEQIAAMFGVAALACHHTYLVLTKRARRMRDVLQRLTLDDCWAALDRYGVSPTRAQTAAIRDALPPGSPFRHDAEGPLWPLPNCWIGVSVEDQATADERIPLLLDCPAAVRWVSAEPLLGPVDFGEWLTTVSVCGSCGDEHDGSPDVCPACGMDCLVTVWGDRQLDRIRSGERYENDGPAPDEDGSQLHWCVAGSESGRDARPMELQWIRSVVDQFTAAGLTAFTKQIATPKDPKGGRTEFWPAGTWPREFPRGLEGA